MSYLVTGATGFIGRHLVANLLKRKGTIHVLVRRGSQKKLDALIERMGWDRKRIVPVVGDLAKPRLGLNAEKTGELKGKVKHFFHLAAIYDLAADAQSQMQANVEGTRNAIALAEAVNAGCFHYASSIAVAGLYPGTFREDMFDEAEDLDHPYFRTKHDAEKVLREECKRPYRIYRPGVVVGHSKTGEIDKIDGPYYFFGALKKLRELLPPWMPVIGIEAGGSIWCRWISSPMRWTTSRTSRPQRGCFHLTDPDPRRTARC